jgi:hypothetical protein
MTIRSSQRRPRPIKKLTITLCIVALVILAAQHLYRHGITLDFASCHLPRCCYTSTVLNQTILFDKSSYSIHHYPEFVCPQNFRNLADWIYGWPNNVFEEKLEHPTNETGLIVPELPHGSIIYVKTDSCALFFATIYPHIEHPFVLVTGQGDASAPRDYLSHLDAPGSKIIHWFGQNADIDNATSPKFTHIPIGTFRRLI